MSKSIQENSSDKKILSKKGTKSNIYGVPTTKSSVSNNQTPKDDISLVYDILKNNMLASTKLDLSELEKFTTISNNREQLYALIDTMCQDSTISSIIKTYAEDVCAIGVDNNQLMWVESNDPAVARYVNYLLKSLNIDRNLYSWAYNLIKYGDIYIKIFRQSDYGDDVFSKDAINKAISSKEILCESTEKTELTESTKILTHNNISDTYSGYLEMVSDPNTIFEVTKFGQTSGFIQVPASQTSHQFSSAVSGMGSPILSDANSFLSSSSYQYQMNMKDVIVYQADDFAHAALEENISRFPETITLYPKDFSETDPIALQRYTYKVKRGKSILQDVYKVWREKQLLEASALLNRLTRSSVTRQISVEVGDMPKEQAQLALHRVKELFEQKSSLDAGSTFSEYTNPGPIENNVYFATHNGQGAISVQNIGGDFDPKELTDLDWWNNKFYASFGIPKQYFGWTDDSAGFNGGSSLSIISSVYSKSIIKIQNSLIQLVTQIINLFLIQKGVPTYINKFSLKMARPATQETQESTKNFSERVNSVSTLLGLFSDIDNPIKHLILVKELVTNLNLGDKITEILSAEIDDLKKKEMEENLEKEKAKEAENTKNDSVTPNIDVNEESDTLAKQKDPLAGFKL